MTIEERIDSFFTYQRGGLKYMPWDSRYKIKDLISDIIREIVGKDEEVNVVEGGAKKGFERVIRNQFRQKIRQRAKKLGLEV